MEVVEGIAEVRRHLSPSRSFKNWNIFLKTIWDILGLIVSVLITYFHKAV